MQICAISPLDDLSVLPKGPLLAFLLVQNGGYLVAFTAGGQTLGKMAAGIRVVPSDSDVVARSRPRVPPHADVGRAGRAGRPRLPRPRSSAAIIAASTIASPARASFARRLPDRATSRPMRALALALATALGVGYAPVAPGTFGSAVGLLLWWLLPASPAVQAAVDRRALRRRLVERQRRRAPLRPHRSRPGRHRRSDGHAHHAVPEPGRLDGRARRRSCSSASSTSIKPYPANRLEQLHGGIGVMADDAMAAIYANLALRVGLALSHRVIW